MQTGNQSAPVQTSRVRHVLAEGGVDVSLLYTNFNGGEVPGAGDLVVRAALEVGSVVLPLHFRGARRATVSPGGWVQTDPIGISVSAGQTVWVRTTRTTETSAPNTIALRASAGEGRVDEDRADSGAVPVVSNEGTPAYGPLALLALDGARGVALIGSSSSNGVGETVPEDGGFMARALGEDIPLIRLNNSGGTAAVYIDPATSNPSTGRRRLTLASAAESAWVTFGGNDVNVAGATFESVRDALLRLWTALDRRGLRVFQSTLIPWSTSSDGWQTPESQTPYPGHAARVALNGWIRGTPAPLSGYFEAADVVETARDSGLWRAGLTADGVHATTAGHEAIAASIRPAVAKAFGGVVPAVEDITDLRVTVAGPNSVDLAWSEVQGATRYVVRWSPDASDPGVAEVQAEVEAAATPVFRVMGLVPATPYRISARALLPDGAGPWTPPVVTTTAALPPLPVQGLIARWVADDVQPSPDGGGVATWTSRVGEHLLTAPATRRPELRAAADGGSAVHFAEGRVWMDAPSVVVAGATCEVLVGVFDEGGRTGAGAVLSVPGGAPVDGRRQLLLSGSGAQTTVAASAGETLVSGRPVTGAPRVVGVRFRTSGRQGEVRVGADAKVGNIGYARRDGLRIGAGYGGGGATFTVREVLVYSALSQAQWDAVFDHLVARYALG